MRWRLPLILLLVIALLPAIAWLTWPWWSAPALRLLLAREDATLQQVSWQRPGWQHLHIDSIAVRLAKPALTLRGRDITLDYRPAGLLQGRLQHIAAEQLDLDVPSASKQAATGSMALPLPGTWLPLIPAASVQVSALHVVTAWPTLPTPLSGHLTYRNGTLTLALASTGQQALALDLRATDRNRINLLLRRNDRDLLSLDNDFIAAGAQLQMAGSLHADAGALAALIPAAPAIAGHLSADWHGSLPRAVGPDTLRQMTASGSIGADFSLSTPAAAITAGTIASHYTLQNAQLTGVIDQLHLHGTVASPPAAISRLLHAAGNRPLPFDLTAAKAAAYRVDLATAHLQWQPAGLQLQLGDKVRALARINDIEANLGGSRQLRAHAVLTTPSLALGPTTLRPARIEAAIRLDGNTLRSTWSARDSGNLYTANGTLTHDLGSNAGGTDIHLQPVRFREDGRYLPALLHPWHWPADLSGGSLTADGRVRWGGSGLRAALTARARDVAGFYNRTLLQGLNATIDIAYRDGQLSARSTAPVTIAEVNAGLPIHDIRFELTDTPRTLTLGDFVAHVLGGTVQQQRLIYYRGRADQHMTLELHDLQLAQILSLQQGVEGSGTLDGTLPLQWHDGRLSSSGARILARAPGGTLRYQGNLPAAAAANQGLALAMTALRNFHYHTMAIDGDYAESGDLALTVNLQGRNPQATDTPPVNFNLTIHENVPDLLRSLQLGGEISDRIERRIKELRRQQQRSPLP